MALFDGSLGGGLHELVQIFEKIPPRNQKVKKPQALSFEEHEKNLKNSADLVEKIFRSTTKSQEHLKRISEQTHRLDRFLLHPFFGLIFFFIFMSLLFTSIFWIAAPFMDYVDSGFSWLAEQVSGESLWQDFLSSGIIASFGAVFVFVPQIFILFAGISILESSGYLARAATLIDRPFSKIGLSGRSFVPILSGFACAVPAMMATRNIPSQRDRWITNFIIPLMSCSARLPVYALLLSFLFAGQPAWKAGIAMTALYIGSLVVGALVSGVLHRILPQNQNSFFMMELPLYRLPKARVILRHSFDRTMSYVKRAGPPIFIFAVLIWVGTTFPRVEVEQDQLTSSYLGQVGQYIEPVFKPMGLDWRVGVGLLSAFAAREVFVSSLALVFHVAGDDEDAQQASLLKSMSTATNSHGEPLFTTGSVIGLLIFFMIALQCMSTVAISVRENRSWKFAMTQLVAFNILAYILAVVAYQIF